MRRGNCYSRPFLLWIRSLVVESETSIFGHGMFLLCVLPRVAYPLTRNSSADTSMSSVHLGHYLWYWGTG